MTNLTAKDATAQIIGLINSRPISPRPDEIEAIIAGRVAPAVATSASTLPDHVVAYHDRVREFLRQGKIVGPMHPTEPTYDAEYERDTEFRVDEVGAAILDTPA